MVVEIQQLIGVQELHRKDWSRLAKLAIYLGQGLTERRWKKQPIWKKLFELFSKSKYAECYTVIDENSIVCKPCGAKRTRFQYKAGKSNSTMSLKKSPQQETFN